MKRLKKRWRLAGERREFDYCPKVPWWLRLKRTLVGGDTCSRLPDGWGFVDDDTRGDDDEM